MSGAAEPRPLVAWAVIAAGWTAAAVIINPAGDFPLNDDWAYGRVVQSLHVLGQLQFPGEVAVSLVAQSAWGLLFTTLFGFSFSVLRLSTLVAGFLGVAFSFELFRALGVPPAMRWLGILSVGFTPLYLSLSYTFMTDVFFFTACVGALLFYVHFLRTRRERYFWVALGFSLVAAFTRDVGLVVPVSIWIARVMKRGSRDDVAWWRAGTLVLVCAAALVGYQQWLVAAARMPAAYGIHAERLPDVGARWLLDNALVSGRAIVCYLGLLLFPVLFPAAVGRFTTASRRERVRALAVGGTVAGALLAWCFVERAVLSSFVGNILSRASLGPVVLPSASRFLGSPNGVFWIPVTLLAIAGAALLAMLSTDVIAAFRRRADAAFATVGILAAAYLAALLVTVVLDRYFLLLLPLTVVLVGGLVPRPPRWALSVSVAILAVMVGWSIAGTHDCLAWNRARWVLANKVLSEHPPNRLDGGLEVDAWHAYPLERPFVSDRSWWWIADKPFVITLGELPRYQLVAREPARTWLPFGDGYIYLVVRE
jgi:hypothetical protein